MTELSTLGPEVHVVVGWSRTTMLLTAGGFLRRTDLLIADRETEPYAPPKSLLDWARRQSLVPVQQYKTVDEFYARVFVALGSMEPKLENVHDPSCFWDIQYDGNKIVSRQPKREEDLHSIIQSVLADHLFLSSIDVVREYTTPAGTLDFLLTGNIADGTTGKVCVEFKNTHSPNFMRGLKRQLPAYMKAAGVDVRAYCGLNFSGEWLATKAEGHKRTAEITVAIRALGTQQWPNPIQYFEYHLGKRLPASRI